jgi:hypothetical protein
MGCVASIPERGLVWGERKELTPISTDVFISIPERAWKGALYRLLTYPTYQVSIGSDIFEWLNMSST